MRLLGRKLIADFQRKHPGARGSLSAWAAEVEEAHWKSPQDIKHRYPRASIIRDEIIIFDVSGNKYRLEARVSYSGGIVSVARVGTHAEYNRWTW